MKIALFGKNINNDCIGYIKLLVEKLENEGISLMVYEPFFKTIEKQIRIQNRDNRSFRWWHRFFLHVPDVRHHK